MGLKHPLKLNFFGPLLVAGFCSVTCVNSNLAQDAATNLKTLSVTNLSSLPNLFDRAGRVTPEGYRFTTQAYNRQALRLVIEEANKAAGDLQLTEDLPITEASLASQFILGYGQSLAHQGAVGEIHTANYGYYVSLDHKLCYVEGAHQDRDCQTWVDEYQWPKSRIDKDAAYQLATQWLAAAHMDVKTLNRDCKLKVEPEQFWNQRISGKKFVPIFDVYWMSRKGGPEDADCIASVKLFLPTKTLISLRVEDSNYILRPPVVFTNLALLLSATNSTALTNTPPQ